MAKRVTVDDKTFRDLERLARKYETTPAEALKLAVQALRQKRMGEELGTSLRADEVAWLSADLG